MSPTFSSHGMLYTERYGQELSARSTFVLPSKRKPNRRAFTCLPCREHKVKCDRAVPCQSCIRNDRKTECLADPAVACSSSRSRRNIRRLSASTGSTETFSAPSIYNLQVPRTQPFVASQLSQPPVTPPVTETPASATYEPYKPPLNIASYAMLKVAETFESQATWSNKAIPSGSQTSNMVTTAVPTFLTCSKTIGSTTADVEELTEWRIRLIDKLPNQSQCDILVSCYFENHNYSYQAVHEPSFRKSYVSFWLSSIDEVNLIWLSLLFSMISLSVLYLPTEVRELIRLEPSQTDDLPQKWYSASRQSLLAGGAESRPCILQLQTFLVTQQYWYSVEDVETLNSCLGQAVRAAQALELDSDTTVATSLDQEMRHRIWWDLCSSDVFQAMCLNRQPLIQAYSSPVPLPLNCNDVDMTESYFTDRPINEPTQMSMHVFRAQATKILSRLYVDRGSHLSSLEFVSSIDSEICQLMDQMPWYLRIKDGHAPALPDAYSFIRWQHHLFHTFICVQRLRMYRPFLRDQTYDVQSKCFGAAESALSVYQSIRKQNPSSLAISRKSACHSYQIFATAISLALLLLVERPANSTSLRADVEMVISDLDTLMQHGINVPIAIDGSKVLRRVLEIHDRQPSDVNVEPISKALAVYSIVGGTAVTQQYLARCSKAHDIREDSETNEPQTLPSSSLDGLWLDPYSTDIDYVSDMLHFSIPTDSTSWIQFNV